MSEEAELAVLGSCLVDAEAVSKTVANLRPEHFTDPVRKLLFETIAELRKDRIEIDPILVWDYVSPKQREILTKDFLIDLAEKVPTALHVAHYIDIVQRDFLERRLIDLHTKAQATPTDPKILKEIQRIWNERAQAKNRFKDLDQDLTQYLNVLEDRMKGKTTQVFTSYPGYDRMTDGHRPGQLIVVGARTSRGKTTFLLCLADRFSAKGQRVLFFSAEMGYEELVDRILSARTKIPLGRIRNHILKADMPKLVQACGDIHRRPLYVNDGGRLSIDAIRAGIESHKPDIVMVDYIQRFIPPGGDNRAAYFSNVANELKALARDKGVIIFASSQLSRAMEDHGKERKPNLADLKESGGIEEASDIVILLHSKKSDDIGPSRPFEFIFAKQRNGPLGSVRFVFLKNTVSFEEAEDEALLE